MRESDGDTVGWFTDFADSYESLAHEVLYILRLSFLPLYLIWSVCSGTCTGMSCSYHIVMCASNMYRCDAVRFSGVERSLCVFGGNCEDGGFSGLREPGIGSLPWGWCRLLLFLVL